MHAPFLYTMALGDSYGMKYEYLPHPTNAGLSDLVHADHPKLTAYKKGDYTDDTQMSLANMELLLAKKSFDITAEEFVNAWLHTFKRDPHVGYSRHMQKLLAACETPAEFVSQLAPSSRTTSGAAMRAGVFGVIEDLEEVKRLTLLQGRITHNNLAGTTSALAVALSVHYLHHGGTRQQLEAFLTAQLGEGWEQNGIENDPGNAMMIVTQALSALKHAKTIADVFLNVVNQIENSDTDTVCAIAAIIASRCTDLEDNVPETLKKGLENGKYGADYLRKIDIQVEAMFPRRILYSSPNIDAR